MKKKKRVGKREDRSSRSGQWRAAHPAVFQQPRQKKELEGNRRSGRIEETGCHREKKRRRRGLQENGKKKSGERCKEGHSMGVGNKTTVGRGKLPAKYGLIEEKRKKQPSRKRRSPSKRQQSRRTRQPGGDMKRSRSAREKIWRIWGNALAPMRTIGAAIKKRV